MKQGGKINSIVLGQYGDVRSQAAYALLQPAFVTLAKVQAGSYEPQDVVNLGMVAQMIKMANNRKMITSNCADDLIAYARKMGRALVTGELEYEEREIKALMARLASTRNAFRFVPIKSYDGLITHVKSQIDIKIAMREIGLQGSILGDEEAPMSAKDAVA